MAFGSDEAISMHRSRCRHQCRCRSALFRRQSSCVRIYAVACVHYKIARTMLVFCGTKAPVGQKRFVTKIFSYTLYIHSHIYTHMLETGLRQRVSARSFCSILTDIGTSVRVLQWAEQSEWFFVCLRPFTSLHSIHTHSYTERAFNYVASASYVDQGRTTAHNTHRSHDD